MEGDHLSLKCFQGDLEKRELHIEPIDMMNREKRDLLPALQVKVLALPLNQSQLRYQPQSA